VRLARDEWYMRIAEVVALRGTCLRRQVGCVLVNRRGHILSTGYNGVPRGAHHCNHENDFEPKFPYACPAARQALGQGLDQCRAIHAEQNALLQCPDVDQVWACYSTVEPCAHCTKLLLNTGCQEVYYRQPYDGHGELHWRAASRKIENWRVLTRP
jgi:dCMP deaminase